jgi:hypothetical protein
MKPLCLAPRQRSFLSPPMLSMAALALVVLLPEPAAAQVADAARIVASPADQLKVVGWLGEAPQIIGTLRLSAEGGKGPVKVRALPSDLMREEGRVMIGQQSIELVGDPTLEPNDPRNFLVKVAAPQEPGVYKGAFEVLPVGGTTAQAAKIVLVVDAQPRPALEPVRSDYQRQAVRRDSSLSQWLARMILPADQLEPRWEIKLNNPLKVPVTVDRISLVATGERGNGHLGDHLVTLPTTPVCFEAQSVGTLPLSINRDRIPPDRYTGYLDLSLGNSGPRVKVPLTLSMRIGPILPLVILAVGVGLGRGLRWFQERGLAQSDALGRAYTTLAKVNQADPADAKILRPLAGEVFDAVYANDIAEADAKIQKVEARLDTLNRLRKIEAIVNRWPDLDAKTELLKEIGTARDLVQAGDDAEAKQSLVTIEAGLPKLQPQLMNRAGRAAALKLERAAKLAKQAGVSAGKAAAVPATSQLPFGEKVRGFIARLVGLSRAVNVHVTTWFFRPLIYLFSFIVLILLGFKTLYIDRGASMGADPFNDFLALISWGFSTDVLSRGISNIQVASPNPVEKPLPLAITS